MKNTNSKIRILGIGLALAFFAAPVFAGEMVYQPVNPNFGGSPFNGAPLLNSANAQNNFDAPAQSARDSARDFAERLDRAILSALSRALTQDILDENGNFVAGTFQTGINTIVVTELAGGGSQVLITNTETGETSTIVIPAN